MSAGGIHRNVRRAIADDDLAIAAFGLMAGTALTLQVASRFSLHSSKHLARSTEWISSLADTIESWYLDHWRPSDDAAPTYTPPGYSDEPVVSPAFKDAAFDSVADPVGVPPAPAVTPAVSPVSGSSLSSSSVDPGECKSRVAALALGLIPFGSFGLLLIFGLHRFYAGKYVTGFL